MSVSAQIPNRGLQRGLAPAIVILWGAAIATLGAQGAFIASGDALPLALMAAVALPLAAFAVAYRTSAVLRDWVQSLDLALVVSLQALRALGLSFVILWYLGHLPAVFALPAGLGDFAVAAAALGVTVAVARQSAEWQRASRWLVIAGMADFVVAILAGLLADGGRLLDFAGQPSAGLMQELPLILIPAFAVPLFMILHAIAWIRSRTGS